MNFISILYFGLHSTDEQITLNPTYNTCSFSMSGSLLVKKLEQLGLAEDGSLVGSDLDWLFIGADNAPLKDFFSWLCENINSSDILTTEELQEYV